MSIGRLETEIRDLINTPRYQHQVMQDPRVWGQICASLDVIGDTQYAIESYWSTPFPSDDGLRCIYVYGLLQALILQQDSVIHLAEDTQVEIDDEPDLKRVREIRNDASGHPSKRGKGSGRTSHQISRISIFQAGFTLYSLSRDATATLTRNITLDECTQLQGEGIERQLRQILDGLNAKEDTHRMNFRDKPLRHLFSASFNYYFNKIAEGIGGRYPDLGAAVFEDVVGQIDRFREALFERGELRANDVIAGALADVDRPIERLRSFFSGGVELDSTDAQIFAFYLFRKTEELARMAAAIDEEYAERPTESPAAALAAPAEPEQG